MMSRGQEAAVLFLGGIIIRSTDPLATTFGRSHPAQLPRLSTTAGWGPTGKVNREISVSEPTISGVPEPRPLGNETARKWRYEWLTAPLSSIESQ